MKKIIALFVLVPNIMFGSAQGVSRPKSVLKIAREAVDFVPAQVVITAIVNLAHNPVTVVHAKGCKPNSEKLYNVACTIPSGKSTADPVVCEKKMHTVLEYKQESSDVVLHDLSGFHIATGHGTYTFANSQYEVAAYQLTKSCLAVEKMKPLLAPWPEERKVELVVGHDGKIEMRLPGSLAKQVRSEKSKTVKK